MQESAAAPSTVDLAARVARPRRARTPRRSWRAHVCRLARAAAAVARLLAVVVTHGSRSPIWSERTIAIASASKSSARSAESTLGSRDEDVGRVERRRFLCVRSHV